ncbi:MULTISPECIES: FecR family protein [Pseudomonas syringae group]|uniref:Peptide ABC transporter substrate-binding protein n=2 Tax=Pseudomonas syringae group TaxID=136849 RepID=A0A2K4WWK4_PSESX|nr:MULTISPECIES: FecR family protein [Pseudomonas syringae group]AVB14488.1 FecR family protein [Pseudomonas amygdali pv. morsprunorum]KWS54661.1 peptide ABC transporter substrate-binding protein [Pseudomonas amygdali pv. morsprunorum]KWS68395.1 peptide ABC transporter substrate-binding protein [Pseudomonas amygdali pv. morsprunorum]MBD1107858.1 FecR family protein [Pseudomonas amygdali pv. morsprunorum]MBI6728994.1 FecR family protein [Pseudomonas amygdali]
MSDPLFSKAEHDAITDAAAHWCMRLHAEDCTAAERKAFEQWLKAHPLHAVEYEAMREVWDITGQIEPLNPAPALPIQATQSNQPVLRRKRRVAPLAAAAAVIALAVPVTGYVGWNQGWLPDTYESYNADTATRLVVLADGSRAELNLGTELTYANYKDRGSVTLKKGEAFFEVSHDNTHPFVVDAGKGSIKVTGTRFNVWMYQDQVRVTLVEGSVQVSSDRAHPSSSHHLDPGMQASYKAGDDAPLISQTDTKDSSLAWRNGKLIFNDLPLSQALPLINRYLQTPILLADTATGAMRLGGSFNTRDLSSLLASLPKVLPVYVTQNQNGNPVLNRRIPDAPKG